MRRKGFTLIEVLLSVVIFTMAVLMSSGAIVLSARIRDRVEAMREIQDEVRFVSEFISREVKTADSVSVGCVVADTKICDSMIITRTGSQGETLTETISPTIDNRSIMMKVVNGASGESKRIISSDRVFLRKLRFTSLVDDEKYAVKVEIAVEEASYSKLGSYNSNKLNLVGSLAKPTRMELRFIASNISSIDKITTP